MIKILWLHFYFSGCWHFATNRFRTSAKNWYLCERRCKWYKGLKRLLKIIVKTEMFIGADIPEPSNKRFFPRTSTIRNHTTHTKRKLCPMIDQDCLQEKIKQCKLSDKSSNIFFRPKTFFSLRWNCWKEFRRWYWYWETRWYSIRKNGNNIIPFVYQNGWQKRLFARYGNKLTLLDSTYRRTRYALPLFFLVVKTNIVYQIVAVFVTENEIEESIEEA